jgi:hypothetical protein
MRERVIFSKGNKNLSDKVEITFGCSILMIRAALAITLIAAIIYVFTMFN